MASVLSGFSDSDAWARHADGTIVGRARDRSYKEVARDGVPIDVLVAAHIATPIKSSVDDETLLATPPHPTTSTCQCDACAYAEMYGAPLDDPDDFEQYFVAVTPRSVARARRTGAKKASKPPKYGFKPTKLHTVAARTPEPLPTSEAMPRSLTPKCSCCGVATTSAGYESREMLAAARICQHCPPAWVAWLADWKDDYAATLAAIEAEREELRMERRMRDARYRD
jgi:hypothetical protein